MVNAFDIIRLVETINYPRHYIRAVGRNRGQI